MAVKWCGRGGIHRTCKVKKGYLQLVYTCSYTQRDESRRKATFRAFRADNTYPCAQCTYNQT
eukprot:1244051-Amphidinium_carterae.1